MTRRLPKRPSLGIEEEVDGEDEGNPKPSLLVPEDPVLKDFQDTYPEDFKVMIQLFTDPSAIKTVIGANRDHDDQDDFQDILRTNTGRTVSMVDKGDFTLEAFRRVHRPLPPASGHVDSSPPAKDVTVTFENLTKLSKKEVAKGFETANGGSLLTRKWGIQHQQRFEKLYTRAMSGSRALTGGEGTHREGASA